MSSPFDFVRSRVEKEILSNSGIGLVGVNYEAPLGDPGLFGPESACWKVHRDFTSMIIGGFSALLLQMLHPLALAGVWEHSNFRNDMMGRLRRTAQFVAGTTFGNKEDAEKLISKVRTIHSKVNGTLEDGRQYSAMDPKLLTWVHVAEARSFLTARVLYMPIPLTDKEQDQYYDEYSYVAEALGAEHVPKSRLEVDSYLQAMRSELVYDDRTREVFEILQNPTVEKASQRIYAKHAMTAAIDMLPDFAKDYYPTYSQTKIGVSKTALQSIAPLYRWTVRNGAYAKSMRRMGLTP